jgi:hypothetical protein
VPLPWRRAALDPLQLGIDPIQPAMRLASLTRNKPTATSMFLVGHH